MNTRILFSLILVALFPASSLHAGATNSKGFSAPQLKNDTHASGEHHPIGFIQRGNASFYGGYWDGRKTANGEIYNQMSLTAAHRTLPFNCKVRVRNLLNDREVTVRINNRGPYVRGRIIDLSVAAANKLDMRRKGVVPVEIRVIQ